MNRRSRRLKIIKMFERPVTRLKLFNKDCQSMRLIRKLALPKQKHPPPKVLFSATKGAGAPPAAAEVRFSGRTIVDEGELVGGCAGRRAGRRRPGGRARGAAR